MKTLKRAVELFRYNFSAVFLFELLYRLISLAIIAPILYLIVNYSIKAAGIKYLSSDNVLLYFTSPPTYVMLFILLLVITMFLLVDASALIYAIESSRREEKTNALILLIKGTFNSLRVLHPKNMGAIIYMLLVLPFTYSVMLSGSLVGLRLPEFLNKLINIYDKNISRILIIYFLLCFLSMFLVFSLNYFTNFKMSYAHSVSLSIKAVKKNFVKIFVGVVVVNLVITAILVLLQGTVTTALVSIVSKFITSKKMSFVVDLSIQVIFFVIYVSVSLISTPFVYSYISACFYEIEEDVYEERDKVRKHKRKKERTPEELEKLNKVSFVIVLVAVIIINGVYVFLNATNRVSFNVAYSTWVDITAHRGDSANAPENTMAAIKLANENGADIIEIDVRQTKDGRYILMHDENLVRTTGENERVGVLDYEYISTLDAGSYFSEEYAGEKIPTLEEVVAYAVEEDIFLNIELKPAKTDQNYEDGIVEIIEAYDYVDKCVVASINYDTIANVKKLNPDITTAYIMTMAFGEFEDLQYADIFSVRHNFVDSTMVNSIHQKGKKIYAWTANKEDDIKDLLLLDVDSIITDDPYKTKDIMYNANDTLMSDWIERFMSEF